MNYCSLSYSAAAVITNEDGVDDVPYLDKFTVGRKSQVLIYHWKCVGEKMVTSVCQECHFEERHGNFIS